MLRSATSMVPVRRGIRRAFHQISRDRTWGTTLLLLTAAMMLAQFLLLFLLGVQGVSGVLIQNAGIQLEVVPSAREQDIQSLYAYLQEHPLVERAAYITRQQAFEQQRARNPELTNFLEEYKLENPFPDTFAVTLRSLSDYDEFAGDMQDNRWRSVIAPSFLSSFSAQEREVQTLLRVTDGLKTLSTAFIVIAVALLFFVILEWVSRNASRRQHELLLEHVLGASASAVLLPFVAEMTMFLGAAFLGGLVLTGGFVAVLPSFMPVVALDEVFQLLQLQLQPLLLTTFPLILILAVLALPVLAYVGTVLGTRKSVPVSFSLMS